MSGISKGAHSWGHSDDDDNLVNFVDDPDGLKVFVLNYSPIRTEAEYLIPIDSVPSLIRRLVEFSTQGEISKGAERLGFKEDEAAR